MKSMGGSDQVLKLVNFGASYRWSVCLGALQEGESHIAPFRPIGRSLRRDASDWLFVTVGSKHIRLWAIGKDPVAIAQKRTVWGIPLDRVQPSREPAGNVTFPLPPELASSLTSSTMDFCPSFKGSSSGSNCGTSKLHANVCRCSGGHGTRPLPPRN